ncbi:hypothetical protein FPZ12_029670 [Amycolatopsis acidicola]|uniref:Uncharacterized protein n=1 Tax=Amycolatopsis acidicola TaxID=2596893 RepID=A0A5N0UVA8_9PSEU|nr:hypothetical protein [Amycolatopsis acidicola]KAA9155564.1 hypothetical protein FPZ12_029670 [Amycolatopsis acidicola]
MSATTLTHEKHAAVHARPSVVPVTTKEITEMLMYEELARARIQELREDVHAQQTRSHARAARRWDRMSRWAAQRARRHRG